MTVEELQQIMSQRFEAQDKMIAQRFEAQDKMIAQRFDAQDQRFEALEKRQDRIETRMDRMEGKLDKVVELVAIQHGERVFAVRFWKHAAWIAPTVIALAALIKSFFL
ncbi:hypothetical protein C6503_14040 [Candidatus Poribacteria bacterium]|nr:MAG: hypothetical protein C6503_14040 [Candidatus Poribacteria bacterium]